LKEMNVAQLTGIVKEYTQPGDAAPVRVLDRLSLTVVPGETIAVTGPSGSGKTTFLNILGTLDEPTAGEVILGTEPIRGMDETRRAALRNRYIGFVFQQHILLPQLTILENVMLPVLPVKEKNLKQEAQERAVTLLEKVGMKDHLRHFPGRLSVGECQRAAVVRALVNKPSLLLADEPTGSLDAHNAALLADLLSELSGLYGYALVMVTHDPEVARKMSVHYRLLDGALHPERLP